MNLPTRTLFAIVGAIALTACGDSSTNDAKPAKAADISPDDYRKRAEKSADSMLATAKPAGKLVESLGKGYALGSVELRDTIAALAQNTECYTQGRKADPYLAGTVSVMAHMAPIGIDLIQIQDSKWTSPAGDLVNACLNTDMRKWRQLDMRYGKPAAYIVQVQFKLDSALTQKPKADSAKADAKPAPKKKP